MSKLAYDSGVITITPAADQSANRGFLVSTAGALPSNFTTTLPLGVIVDGQPTTGKSSVAVAPGLVVKVKLSASPGSVVFGSVLALDSATPGAVKLSPGAGTARVEIGRALEAGAANELIDVVLWQPVAGV